MNQRGDERKEECVGKINNQFRPGGGRKSGHCCFIEECFRWESNGKRVRMFGIVLAGNCYILLEKQTMGCNNRCSRKTILISEGVSEQVGDLRDIK